MQDLITKSMQEIAGRYDLDDIYVFGSRAREIAARVRGEGVFPDADDTPPPHSVSDVDIAVFPRADAFLDARRRVRLMLELEDLFDVSRVDLVLLPEADPFLALDIIRGELLYSRDPDRQAKYELFVLRRAGDLLPFQRERIRSIFEDRAQ